MKRYPCQLHSWRLPTLRGLTVGALAALLAPALAAQTAELPSGSRLRTLGGTNGLYVGGTLKTGFTAMADAADYGLVAGREFDLFSPENCMKMRNLQPTQGTFTWAEAEAAVQFAATKSADFHGHMLVGGQGIYNPTWLFSLTTAAAVESAMHAHIDAVMGHWAPATGRPPVKVWEVANESFLDSPPSPVPSDWKLGLRTSQPEFITDPGSACTPGGATIRNPNYDHFVATIGPTYIEKAFRRARLNDANAVLMYNDFGAEGLTTKAEYLYKMMQDFTNSARSGGVVPIDAVGFQCHFNGAGRTPAEIRQNFDRFSALGLDVYVSELDWVATRSADPLVNAQTLDLQARRYYNFLEAAMRVPGFAGVQVWGIGDKYTFHSVPAACTGVVTDKQPLPFDEDYNAKPAYYAMQDALGTQQRTQVVSNANFEGTTLSPWTSYGGATLTRTSAGNAHAGSYAVKASGRTVAASGPGQNVTSALVANGAGRYFVRAWVKVQSGTASVKLTLRLQDSAQTAYKTITPVTVGTTWTLVSGWINATWFKALTAATLYAETTGSLVDFYVDDLVLGDGNLAANGTFEAGTGSWSNNFGGTIAETNDTAGGSGAYRYGTKGVQVTGRTQAYHGVAQNVLTELLASGRGTYTLCAWQKLFAGAAGTTGKVTLRLRDAGVDTYYSVSAPVNATSWEKVAGTVALDWTTLTQATLYVETGSGTASYYADEIVMRR